MDFCYPVYLKVEEDEVGLLFPDFPEIVSWHPARSTDTEDLKEEARDALLTALQARVSEGDEIPEPSEPEGCDLHVRPPALAVMKLALYQQMRADGLSRQDLAKRIGKSDTMVSRILDLSHNSTISQIEGALASLGRSLVISADTAQRI